MSSYRACQGRPSSGTRIMSGTSLKALEFQLEEVRSQLAKDPENARAKALATKLEALIQMTKEEEEDEEQNSASCPPERKPEARVESVKRETATNTVELPVGTVCEAKRAVDGEWYEATIQSFAPDRLSCTVSFNGLPGIQHCSFQMVRKRMQNSKRVPLPEASKPFQPPPRPPPVIVPAEKSKPGTGPVRRKHTKAEHDQKKEAEHAVKQQSWQNFKQKFGNGSGGFTPYSKPNKD